MSAHKAQMPRSKGEIVRLLGRERLSFWELLGRWDGRLEDFIHSVNAMYDAKELVVESDGQLALSPELQQQAPETLGVPPCASCKGRGIDLRHARGLLSQLEELLKERPPTTPKYFQGNIDVESAVAKVYQIEAFDGLAGKQITVVGDDDYLSLALALTGLPERIVVLEIDERIAEFIERCARERDFPVDVHTYNVEDPLPQGLIGQSDLFTTEPLETVSGFLTFFSRGAATLKPGGVGYVGLTTLECSRPKWKRIQEEILKMGFVITDLKRRFSHYPMEYPEDEEYVEQLLKALHFKPRPEREDAIWYFAHLIRAEAVEEIRPWVKPDERIKIDVFDQGDDFTYPGAERER